MVEWLVMLYIACVKVNEESVHFCICASRLQTLTGSLHRYSLNIVSQVA